MIELIEVIHSLLRPRKFFIDYLRNLQRDGVEVLIVGTLHNRHSRSRTVGFGLLAAIVDEYSPQCVAIEARAKDTYADRIGLAPIEMAFIWDYCVRLNKKVIGIDFWEDYHGQASRGEKIDFNSADRNIRMASNIIDALPVIGKVLVFVGYAHVRPITASLLAAGFAPAGQSCFEQIAELLRKKHLTILSPSLRDSLSRAATQLDICLSNAGHTSWVRRLRRKQRFLRRFLATF